ncbi:MAG TPA: thioredoxin-dependent thiol peroxidase [Nitrososphaeraceae archaeon]
MTEYTRNLNEGDQAPNFSFTNGSGATCQLTDIIGKSRAVVYFYPRDFTPGCTHEAHDFTLHYIKFKRNDIKIIGVSPDNEESHKKFRDKMKIPYSLASDPNNNIAKSYGVYGPKKFMGREYVGVDRSSFLIGNDGNILKIFKKVKPAGHAEEVLRAFQITE